MSTKKIEELFPKIKYACSVISGLLLIWLVCHLFIRSCGGPFPHRTRGPFAKYEYYQLSEFEDWENFIEVPGEDETLSEKLLKREPIPTLNIALPDKPLPDALREVYGIELTPTPIPTPIPGLGKISGATQ